MSVIRKEVEHCDIRSPYDSIELAMRSFVHVLLALLLLLQGTWAASASYCDHEQPSATAHYGHHVHQHLGQSDSSESVTKIQFAGVDLDCGTCHLGLGDAIMELVGIPIVEMKEAFGFRAIHQILSAFANVPYRPTWSVLA